MNKGDRIVFDGRQGTVVRFMPAGMVDIQFDDAPGRIERRSQDRLGAVAKPNGMRGRRPRSARRNGDVGKSEDLRQAEAKMRQTTRPAQKRLNEDVQTKLYNRDAAMFTRPDPSRLSRDRQTHCGNPIDGTAYYLVVSSTGLEKKWWLTTEEVQKAAQRAGAGLEGPKFLDWFRHYIAQLKARPGFDVYVDTPGPRIYKLLKGGKRGAASPSKTLPIELLEKRHRKPQPAGQEVDPAIAFSLPDPKTGKPVYFRVTRSQSPGAGKLERFSPFIPRRFVAPASNTLNDEEVKSWGALPVALVAASSSDLSMGRWGMSLQVASWLVEAGAVSVSQLVDGVPKRSEVVTDISFVPAAGEVLTIQLRAKADSPFFSWIPTVVPIAESKNFLPPCLSGEDLQFRKDLQVMSNALGAYNSALGRVRALFKRLAEQPGSLNSGDVQKTVVQLANSYARLIRWYIGLEDKFFAGDPVAKRVVDVFTTLAIEPGNAASVFSQSKDAFRNTEGMRGLVSDDGEGQPQIENAAHYVEFMQGLRARVLSGQIAGPTMPLTEGRQELSTASTTAQPGRSALLYLEGVVKPLPHPMDDLFLFVRNSLQPQMYNRLLAMRREVDPRTLDTMRFAQDQPGTTDPKLKAATTFRQLVSLYAQGGMQTAEGKVDPYDDFGFELLPPPGWTLPLDQQEDANWAIGLVVDDVHPMLVWGAGVEPKKAAHESRDLLLLSNLYFMLGGYQLAGPLNPQTPERTSLLQLARSQVGAAEAEVLGGSTGLSTTGAYTAYKTYNPVLFELTRLFWPAKTGSDPAWGSFLAQPEHLANLDAVGRYGYAARVTQQIAASSTSQEQVKYRIAEKVGSALSALTISVSALMRGVSFDPSTQRTVKAPPGLYVPFLLNWPLGMPVQGAQEAAALWIRSPLDYLKLLKEQTEKSIAVLMRTRRVGLSRSERPPAGDMPFLFSQFPAFYPGEPDKGIRGSSLYEAEKAQNEQDLRAMVTELDAAIAQLDRKIGGPT